jgi:hypothetical protein
MRARLLSGPLLLASIAAANATPFDDCVLQHMQGVSSDVAAVSIKEACIRAVEKPLSDAAVQTLNTARAGYGALPPDGSAALYVSLDNESGYTITSSLSKSATRIREQADDTPCGGSESHRRRVLFSARCREIRQSWR